LPHGQLEGLQRCSGTVWRKRRRPAINASLHRIQALLAIAHIEQHAKHVVDLRCRSAPELLLIGDVEKDCHWALRRRIKIRSRLCADGSPHPSVIGAVPMIRHTPVAPSSNILSRRGFDGATSMV
jgi:hypothetical protein